MINEERRLPATGQLLLTVTARPLVVGVVAAQILVFFPMARSEELSIFSDVDCLSVIVAISFHAVEGQSALLQMVQRHDKTDRQNH